MCPTQEANNGSGDMSTRNSQTYMEGFHWVKGPLLGTGAFSTCYQARDARTGVIMAVKQVSVASQVLYMIIYLGIAH